VINSPIVPGQYVDQLPASYQINSVERPTR